MRTTIKLLALAAAAGVAADRLYLELRKPPATQFQGIRHQVNDTLNPWLLEHHIPGGPKAEIGILEHVGRVTGQVRLTPVHPTIRRDELLVPAPMGIGSQWAQNVLHAGRARLQLFETIHELDAPELIGVGETGFFPGPLSATFERLGFRYVRFHVGATSPGNLAPQPVARREPAVRSQPAIREEPADMELVGATA